MDSMTQEAHHRQRMIRYAKKHGATKTAIRYGCGRKTVCKWLNRYESTIESLKNKSRRPHSSPGAQSEKEKKAVPNEYDKDKGGEKLVTYGKCKKGGYAGTYTTFLRTIRRQEKPKKTKRKVVVKEYEKAHYPGQKLRADVKYVPKKCAEDGEKYYRFTIIDEYTRLPFGEIYPDKSTLSSQLFLRKAVRFYSALGINVELIQTDNGTERTKALISKDGNDKTLFEIEALSLGINLKRIRIATPRHNGKVERLHRKDERRFYRSLEFTSLKEAGRKLTLYDKASLHFLMIPLDFKSPLDVLREFKLRALDKQQQKSVPITA